MPMSSPGASAGDHCVIVHTGNGTGSTNTRRRRFTTVLLNVGSIAYADSATLGATFTPALDGLYECYYQDVAALGAWVAAITVNSSEGSTAPASLAVAGRLAMAYAAASTNGVNCSCVVRLSAGDVVCAQAESPSNTTDKVFFSIRRVGA